MSETGRVQRWRAKMKAEGKEAMTLWLTTADKLRLEDLAHTRHCSPSAVVEQALSLIGPGAPLSSPVTDTTQLRELIRAELVMLLPGIPSVSQDTATDSNATVTEAAPPMDTALPTAPAETPSPVPIPRLDRVLQEAQTPPAEPSVMAEAPGKDCPPYDPDLYYLGRGPCRKAGHIWGTTGKALMLKTDRHCATCRGKLPGVVMLSQL